MPANFVDAVAATSRIPDAIDQHGFDALARYGRNELDAVRNGEAPTLVQFVAALSDDGLLNLCARTDFLARMADAQAPRIADAVDGAGQRLSHITSTVLAASRRIAKMTSSALPSAAGDSEKRLHTCVTAMAKLLGVAGAVDPTLRQDLLTQFVDTLYSGPAESLPVAEKVMASIYATMTPDAVEPFYDRADATAFREEVNRHSQQMPLPPNHGLKSPTTFEYALDGEIAARAAGLVTPDEPGRLEFFDRTVYAVNTTKNQIGRDPRLGPAIVRRHPDGRMSEVYIADGEQLGYSFGDAMATYDDLYPAGLPPLPLSPRSSISTAGTVPLGAAPVGPSQPGAYVDLMPTLHAFVDAHPDLSPHDVARQFVIEQGAARGGVEIAVAVGPEGEYLGAGTMDRAGQVPTPPEISLLLKVPESGITVHHNHPNRTPLSEVDLAALGANPGLRTLIAHTESAYSAVEMPDSLLTRLPDPQARAEALKAALTSAQDAAGFSLYAQGIEPDNIDHTAREIGLQALADTGAIHYFSSFNTGLTNDVEQRLFAEVRSSAPADHRHPAGAAIWQRAATDLDPATSLADPGRPAMDASLPAPDRSTRYLEFHQFVDRLSGRNRAIGDTDAPGLDSLEAARTRQSNPGLAPDDRSTGQILESGLSGAHSALPTGLHRAVTDRHQFLSWTNDGTAYLVSWRPAGDNSSPAPDSPQGTMTFQSADVDFDTWCNTPQSFSFRPAVVDQVGMEQWAEQQIAFRHDAHQVERRYIAQTSALHLAHLAENPIPGNFDLAHLQAIHRHVFAGVYDSAGALRRTDVPPGKHPICAGVDVPGTGAQIFGQLAAERALAGLSPTQFSERAGYFLGQLQALQPFSEGNGLVVRAFFSQLAERNGLHINWDQLSRNDLLDGSISAAKGEHGPLSALIRSSIGGLDHDIANELAHAQEPALAEGMTRLYRAEGAPSQDIADWLRQGMIDSGQTEAAGRWFIQDKSLLEFYRDDSGPDARLFYVDVPAADLEQYRVTNNTDRFGTGRPVASYSKDPENEFFLPRTLADQKRSLLNIEAPGDAPPSEPGVMLGTGIRTMPFSSAHKGQSSPISSEYAYNESDRRNARYNQAFDKWFSESVVKDAIGVPITLYHGSTKAGFGIFDTSGQRYTENTGVYFTDSLDVAATYSGNANQTIFCTPEQLLDNPGALETVQVRKNGDTYSIWYNSILAKNNTHFEGSREDAIKWLTDVNPKGPGIYAVHLSIKNPAVIDWGGRRWDDGPGGQSTDEAVRAIKAANVNYDGIIIRNVRDSGPFNQDNGNQTIPSSIYVAFDPRQIKSVNNPGTWDYNNPHVLDDIGRPVLRPASIPNSNGEMPPPLPPPSLPSMSAVHSAGLQMTAAKTAVGTQIGKEQSMDRPDYVTEVAESLIAQLQRGTAPWQRPWEPGERHMPYNPTSEKDYRGLNAIWLSAQGYQDPRWLTFKQASAIGAHVRKGEKSTAIQYWQWTEERPVLEDGRPVKGPDGKAQTVTVQLERPKVFFARVFNAEQIDGLPAPAPRPTVAWERHQQAEAILSAAGVPIVHRDGDTAHYTLKDDQITLPLREQFPTADRYYATALHEEGHATGHPSRLDRDLAHPFGSTEYAREELRAEIASLMIGDRLGIGHNPGQHAAYAASWIEVLRKDPREIFRAAADAEKITQHLIGLTQQLTQEQQPSLAPASQPETPLPTPTLAPVEVSMANPKAVIAAEPDRTYLAVPYAEKEQAKAAAKKSGFAIGWDKEAKAWYAPAGADLQAIAQWLPENRPVVAAVPEDPVQAFAEALAKAGLELDGSPTMDGTLQRVPVDGDKGNERSGAYKGYLDGRPAGYIQNFRTGFKTNWTHATTSGTEIDTAALKAEADRKRTERAQALAEQHEQTAILAAAMWAVSEFAPDAHPYLQRKGVQPHDLRVATAEANRLLNEHRAAAGKSGLEITGHLLVPVSDLDGRVWTLEHIATKGQKGFLDGGKLQGNHFLIGNLDGSGPIILVEGFATGATVHELTGQPVVVAFNSGNLPNVAVEFRQQYPDRAMMIAGDNDKANEIKPGIMKNTGAEATLKAAEVANAFASLPPSDAENIDWNDYAALDRVAAQQFLTQHLHISMLDNAASRATNAEVAATLTPVLQNAFDMEKSNLKEQQDERKQTVRMHM